MVILVWKCCVSKPRQFVGYSAKMFSSQRKKKENEKNQPTFKENERV